ncbi:hypothetical protein DICPUDRAFT_32433 [Dictyostelium purpureum]|uniref:Peptide deformylase n=1 Tax=Dictyostelium purpureum TaxID=5786 RepID=F0ZJ40_DICPU|nr:uncharacterized protein DICPUDRAFT_32433 [Dictyostelium purpureum]EGC36062.1 hypothetical protein DICPUDRAFT_32433 [Dictyostelium purpureum]|eukprot:XP_003287437.1 hypothetical protein DICPUDRAFT_32433 [Dictyostelium purpureum]
MQPLNISSTILKVGNTVLKQKALAWTAKEMSDVKYLESVIDRMTKEMGNVGTGIAAPQIGINKQLFLFEFDSQGLPVHCPNFPLTAFFNPKVEIIEEDVYMPPPGFSITTNKKILNLKRYKKSLQTFERSVPLKQTSNNTMEMYESCLSVPNIFAKIKRAKRCIITFLDITGKERVIDAEGIIAACFQHEYDHLLGRLLVDRLDPKKSVSEQVMYSTELSPNEINEAIKVDGNFQVVR